jgi:hypothetical protein
LSAHRSARSAPARGRARSAGIESDERKSIRRKVAQDIARDQISGDDEDIDADKSALKATDLQMEKHDADDGHGTKPGYLVTKMMTCHRPRTRSLKASRRK